MKQWKLVLVALLSVLLVCTCMSALASEATATPAPTECTHNWYLSASKPGTCKDVAENTFTCTKCQKTKVEYGAINPNNHVGGEHNATTQATCLTPGGEVTTCAGCGVILRTKTFPATGHNMKMIDSKEATCEAGWMLFKCQNANCDINGGYEEKVPVKPTRDHTWQKVDGGVPAKCTVGGTQNYKCTVCGKTKIEKVPALGHKGKTVKTAPTCTEAGSEVTTCERCGYEMARKTIAKLGHATVEQVYLRPTCKTQGLKRVLCTRCGATVNDAVVVPATGHKGKWIVTSPAEPKKNGEKKLICQNVGNDGKVCGEILDTKAIVYSEMMYNNTLAGFGPCTRDLIGGKTWNRVTPVDLSVDGTYTYDLVASNKYVVGTLVVTVANGTVTVNYELNANQIKVNEETLTLYANLEALKNGTGLTATVGTPIDIAANFGEDTKVIVAFAAKADYNAVGAGVASFKADEAKLAALIALID